MLSRKVFAFLACLAVSPLLIPANAQTADASGHAAQKSQPNNSPQPSSTGQKEHAPAAGNPHSTVVQEYHAAPIQAYHAQPIQPYHADAVPPPSRPTLQPSESAAQPALGPRFFFPTFGLAVPGVAYTTDNYATNTRTITTSTGALTHSAVRIHPDHTYEWNSQWDGRVLHGRWVEQKGGILLLHAQEGKDWLLRAKERPSGPAVVTLWDQNSIWYDGTPLR